MDDMTVKAIRKQFKEKLGSTDQELGAALKKAGVEMVKGPPKKDERLFESSEFTADAVPRGRCNPHAKSRTAARNPGSGLEVISAVGGKHFFRNIRRSQNGV